ncbi:MAG TPA: efflux RND transporter periplasmic adaptor subunit [Opitutaceae bacterium]|nr:efflux RND transporter periplasmic adaptor subunit [Opitutaceae bacterium]
MPPPPKPVRWPKILLRTVVLLALLGGAIWGGHGVWKQVSPGLFGNKRQEKIATAKARNATIAEEIVAVGRLRAVFSTELRSEINGRIMKISAIDGQKLTKDQEILRLDQQDLLTQIQEMDRTIEASKLKATRSRRDYERLVDLQQRGVVTNKDFEDARITLSLSENDAAIAEARAANLRDKLTKTVIRAPHDGTLLLRDLTEGQVITSAAAQNGGTLLGEVADLSALMVRTNINEIDVARLQMGDVARIRVDSLRSIIMEGKIKRIATSANESNVDRTRVFPVDVILDTSDERLRPGMSATVMFTLARVDDALAVPLSAVFSTAESVRYVFLKKGERFEVHVVDTGISDNRRVQVLSGLAEGDEVAQTRPLEFDGEIPLGVSTGSPKSKSGKRGDADPTASSGGKSRSGRRPGT